MRANLSSPVAGASSEKVQTVFPAANIAVNRPRRDEHLHLKTKALSVHPPGRPLDAQRGLPSREDLVVAGHMLGNHARV